MVKDVFREEGVYLSIEEVDVDLNPCSLLPGQNFPIACH